MPRFRLSHSRSNVKRFKNPPLFKVSLLYSDPTVSVLILLNLLWILSSYSCSKACGGDKFEMLVTALILIPPSLIVRHQHPKDINKSQMRPCKIKKKSQTWSRETHIADLVLKLLGCCKKVRFWMCPHERLVLQTQIGFRNFRFWTPE